MARLPPETVREIGNIMMPYVADQTTRRGLVIAAFGEEHPLADYINYDGGASDFAINLIMRVNNYGEIEPQQSALVTLLNALKTYIGIEQQMQINALLATLDQGTETARVAESSPLLERQKTVFISYRRKTAGYIARAIFQDLRAHGYDVFMDVEGIDAGDFGAIIRSQIEARVHFLIILTPGTVERFTKPDDWLRREIEYAIDKNRNIVPLLVNEFKFSGTETYLTGKLARLSRFSGVSVPHEYFDEAMGRLRKRFLKDPVYIEIKPAPAAVQVEAERRIEEVAAQPAPTLAELSAEDYFNRAYALQIKADLSGALADYDKAIRLNPQYVDAYYNRGAARRTNFDLKGAIADYQKYLDLGGGNQNSNQATIEEWIRDLEKQLDSQT
jgi:tetratricopeptide (TPR) repeat protein